MLGNSSGDGHHSGSHEATGSRPKNLESWLEIPCRSRSLPAAARRAEYEPKLSTNAAEGGPRTSAIRRRELETHEHDGLPWWFCAVFKRSALPPTTPKMPHNVKDALLLVGCDAWALGLGPWALAWTLSHCAVLRKYEPNRVLLSLLAGCVNATGREKNTNRGAGRSIQSAWPGFLNRPFCSIYKGLSVEGGRSLPLPAAPCRREPNREQCPRTFLTDTVADLDARL
ncbi:hypothetical protein B0T24DRAFT_94759 [Lasiosphaeria ovina]|uniref:Uncharacterized protein n=1 Tax=Lasiosphaeria ovina TaxID=92902 RepID=A0AAE0NNA9_9PEZI|nr:hypothetical protein B0T24DRAFT_94759 [Lasiosphaeria ovina]